ncbi:MAG TPA: hypothetical protein VFE14_12205 [Micromonosporaceae bacterium]|nr:hypothetical protein [Micromonosporaceae bacterium]
MGRIASGAEQGRFVRVEDDRDQSGGFLILTAADPALTVDAADGWVEDEPSLEQYFREANWIIEWAIE